MQVETCPTSPLLPLRLSTSADDGRSIHNDLMHDGLRPRQARYKAVSAISYGSIFSLRAPFSLRRIRNSSATPPGQIAVALILKGRPSSASDFVNAMIACFEAL
ncbi:MAG: hypothetical protein U0361_04955 [Nitrospiraceae bacterium]